MVKLNEYLTIFTGSDMDNKSFESELNEILLHNTPNGWDKKDFIQGFDSETAAFNKSINMFECMEILEYIWGGIVKPYNKKLTRLDGNNYFFIRTTRGIYAW